MLHTENTNAQYPSRMVCRVAKNWKTYNFTRQFDNFVPNFGLISLNQKNWWEEQSKVIIPRNVIKIFFPSGVLLNLSIYYALFLLLFFQKVSFPLWHTLVSCCLFVSPCGVVVVVRKMFSDFFHTWWSESK